LFCLNPTQGETFLVQSISKFLPEEFADVYNQRPPIGLENTKMVFDGHSFKIRVDNARDLDVTGWRLDTYQGRIVLHGTLLGTRANAVTVSVGPFESTVKLSRRQPIVSMTAHGNDFIIGYRHWASDSRIRLRLITTGKPDEQVHHPPTHEISFQPDEVELDAGIGVDQRESFVRVTFPEEARYRAWKYWASAASHNERKGHQGDIGEAVACVALEKSGYRVVERHTVKSERFRPRHQCRALGRDILAVKEGQYYVAEVKHWKEYKELALKAAETELLKFADGPERDELEERLQAKIKGAIAAQLEWSYQSAEAVLHWKYVDLNAGKQRHRLSCPESSSMIRFSSFRASTLS
jgi:hypothetical protein